MLYLGLAVNAADWTKVARRAYSRIKEGLCDEAADTERVRKKRTDTRDGKFWAAVGPNGGGQVGGSM